MDSTFTFDEWISLTNKKTERDRWVARICDKLNRVSMLTLVYVVGKDGKNFLNIYSSLNKAIQKLTNGRMNLGGYPAFYNHANVTLTHGSTMLTDVPNVRNPPVWRRLIQVVDSSDDHMHYIETFVHCDDDDLDDLYSTDASPLYPQYIKLSVQEDEDN